MAWQVKIVAKPDNRVGYLGPTWWKKKSIFHKLSSDLHLGVVPSLGNGPGFYKKAD